MRTAAERGRERADGLVAMLRDQIDDVATELGDEGEEAYLDRLFEAAEDFWVDLIRARMAPRAIGNPRATIIDYRDVEREIEIVGSDRGEATWDAAFRRVVELSGIDLTKGVYVEHRPDTRSYYVIEGSDQSLSPDIQARIRGQLFTREFNPPRRTRDHNRWAYVY